MCTNQHHHLNINLLHFFFPFRRQSFQDSRTLAVSSLDPLYQATQEAFLQHQRIPWAHSWVVLVALQSQFHGQIQQVERTQGLPPFA